MPRYQLRHDEHLIDVPPGEFVVGRSSDCDLVIDDPLVSRRHAVFRCEPAALFVEDLASRNGIKVNHAAPKGRVQLAPGDVVTIGSAPLQVAVTSRDPNATQRQRAITKSTEPDLKPTVVGLRAALIEKAFAMGKLDEAESLMRNFMAAALMDLRAGPVEHGLLTELTTYVLRLARETGKATWLDQLFDAYRLATRVLPVVIVDEMYDLGPRLRYTATPSLRGYLEWLRAQAPRLGATERFVLQRLEGLARVLAV